MKLWLPDTKLRLPKESDRIPGWEKRFVDEYWLGLGDSSRFRLDNPFDNKTSDDIENPALFVLNLMRQPRYFWFTCKHLLNRTLAPFQLAIQRELWVRAFPMLMASRGGSKSWNMAVNLLLRGALCPGTKAVVVGAAFRQAKVVFEYMAEIWEDSPVLRSLFGDDRRSGPRRDVDRCSIRMGESIIICVPLGTGEKIRGLRANIIGADEMACLDASTLVETTEGLVRIGDGESFDLFTGDGNVPVERPDVFFKTPPTECYRVTTKGNYSFICSSIHKVETSSGWKLAKDLTTEDYLLFENNYIFPEGYVERDGLVVDEQLAWLMGILTAEGSINNRRAMSVKMTDSDCVERVRQGIQSLMPDRDVKVSTRVAHTDNRGWVCKESYTTWCCNVGVREALVKLGLDSATAHDKKIPWSILRSPRSVVIAFLSGLFEGDGSAFLWKDGDRKKLGIAYYSVSEQLCQEVQTLLHKLDIFCIRHPRKSNISNKRQWMVRLNGDHAHNLAELLDIPKWDGVVENAERGKIRDGVVWDKSRDKWVAKTYSEGKCGYHGRFATREAAEACVLANKPVKRLPVVSVEKLEEPRVLYDYHLPITHSFYGNCFRQHNSIPPDIFETVVRGFGSVSKDPVLKMQAECRRQAMKDLGLWRPEFDDNGEDALTSNQTIISGTAYYTFNHFYEYWQRYKAIIESRGDKDKLRQIFGDKADEVNWRDYSIIRIGAEAIPRDFMDAKQLANAKATLTKNNYLLEYGCCWVSDSDGFFKRSLIENCVVGKAHNPVEKACGPVRFYARMKGDRTKTHVIAVDPASERDNLAIVVLELWPDHRRIVHVWTTNRKRYKATAKAGLTPETDYYRFAARKIRDLMRDFPCARLAMDSQGGIAIVEALQDTQILRPGERPIYPITDPEKAQDTDGLPGEHILELVSFSSAEWVAMAHHGLKKDLEDQSILFPPLDPAVLALALEEDKAAGRIKTDVTGELEKLYDTLEDCAVEINEMIDEICSIVHTQTAGSLRERWDTPNIKAAGARVGRYKKDRFSALVIANMVARTMERTPVEPEYKAVGGFANSFVQASNSQKPSGPLYIGPSWYTEALPSSRTYGAVVTRSGVKR